ncbi:hypothetical protein Vadar_014036 [Vaccinium darrowii]|uniref:Uncharacterized protein n=1 Tax=Vaccinium darrowii TaxID=229202 RepID=A0ACB7XA60_9ERIC|nr:hypothetical protein Vadar_014036 [Vaccinium darrowii]
MAMILFLVLSLFLQGALGEIICEELPVGLCSFSVASSRKRCVLETLASGEGNGAFQCKTSEVEVTRMAEWIESDACIGACGVDRYSIGISSDALLEPRFTAKLCSPACFRNCRNIVNLYYNVALGEGVYLPDLCKAQLLSMNQILSSGPAAAPSSSISATTYGPVAA